MQSIFCESGRGTNQYIADKKIRPVSDLRSFLDMHFVCVKEQVHQEDDLNDGEKIIMKLFDTYEEVTSAFITSQTMLSEIQMMMHLSTLEMK